MKRVLLYNFSKYKLPDGLDEALSLLGLWAVFDNTLKIWRVYQKAGHERFTWSAQNFIGGDMGDWVRFLTIVTANENRL